MALIYLDNCEVQRPLDDRTQFRVRTEADAIEAVMRAVECGHVRLLTSDVLQAESGAALDPFRRGFSADVLRRATERIALTGDVRRAAAPFVRAGIKAVDALHLTSAVIGRADYFCTADDRFLKKALAANTGAVCVVLPADLALALLL